MIKFILALAVTVALMAVGFDKNSKFRVAPDEAVPEKLRVFIQRKSGSIGIGILPVPLLLAFGKIQLALIFLAIGLVSLLLFVPFILKAKLPLGPWLVVCALVGMGDISRTLFKVTLIGIPMIERFDFKNKYGWDLYMKVYCSGETNTQKTPSLFDILWNADFTSSSFQDTAQSQPHVKVWRENGLEKDYLKVSRDGERYFDPEDGEWHRIK